MTLPGAEALTIILLALVGDGIIAGLPGFRNVLASPIAAMAALARTKWSTRPSLFTHSCGWRKDGVV